MQKFIRETMYILFRRQDENQLWEKEKLPELAEYSSNA